MFNTDHCHIKTEKVLPFVVCKKYLESVSAFGFLDSEGFMVWMHSFGLEKT